MILSVRFWNDKKEVFRIMLIYSTVKLLYKLNKIQNSSNFDIYTLIIRQY